jgi:hypothetical protein
MAVQTDSSPLTGTMSLHQIGHQSVFGVGFEVSLRVPPEACLQGAEWCPNFHS